MVLLLMTPAIAAALDSLPASIRDELSLPTAPANAAISHTQLTALSRYLVSNPRSAEKPTDPSNGAVNRCERFSLNSLLKGTRVYVPPPPPKPDPTPEYLALKASLLAAEEARRYNALLNAASSSSPSRIWGLNDPPATNIYTHPKHHHHHNNDNNNNININTINDLDADDPLTPSVVLNILVSILFTGFATYWALSNFRIPTFFTFTSSAAPSHPGTVSSQPARVFISMLVALLVGVAEVGIFALYLRKVELARERERAIVERKVVIGEVKIGGGNGRHGGDDGSAVSIDDTKGAKEEIWGRGVNGGARRRVKERWKGRDGDADGEGDDSKDVK
ncbi:hypothetical protein I7I51_00555 [Histoplasma capsulatum]|uniref:ATPase, vacuolar ER assembly factor, Vma12 n=1 Tax=Ajellomyces capsulatus TaxID=5037 RepID=A0A8A1MH94_AJECA|nr:predicted protein [Histoplasma mississippiense (nom. inval.)]EDN08896.1 predicted protein [Histoplasma mississippiense (nom. inval.)]QSS63497.1 hypothetical protein I7I51_00555 [Histoplasma capsulatum]